MITIKKLAPAIAAGNTVVIKPSELAPASIVELAALCSEAGLPNGVMNVVLGAKDVCSLLIQNPSIVKVDFTGGPNTGKAIGEQKRTLFLCVASTFGSPTALPASRGLFAYVRFRPLVPGVNFKG